MKSLIDWTISFCKVYMLDNDEEVLQLTFAPSKLDNGELIKSIQATIDHTWETFLDV